MRIRFGTPSPSQLVVGSSASLGGITCLGLLGGLVGVRSTNSFSALLVVAAGIALGVFAAQRLDVESSAHSRTDRFTLVVPGLFLAAGLRWLVRPASIRLSWLFDTWDGTTNPGVVTYSMVTGNIGHDTSIVSQWETYPRAPHFAIGQVARLAEGVGLSSATDRTTIYALGLWFTYSIMLAAVGLVAVRLAQVLGFDRRVALPIALVAQAFLCLATNLEKTLLLHSLSFLTCIAVCMSLVVVWLSLEQRDELHWRGLLLFSLHIVVVVETFPLVLPFVAVIVMVMVARFGKQIPFQSPFAMASLIVPLAIATPRLLDQFQHSTQTDHVATGGHLLALSSGLVVALGLVGILGAIVFAFRHRVGRHAAIVLVGSILVPAAAWVMVGNFDRTYGLNYYPKKVELFTLVVVVAMAPVALLRPLRQFRRHLVGKAAGAITAALVVLAIWNGPLSTPSTIPADSPARRYITAAFDEADNSSESVVFGPNVMMSTYASMMSNLIDKKYWSVGYTNDRLLTIFQQLSVADPNTAVQQLCSVLIRKPAVAAVVGATTSYRKRCDSMGFSRP